jgi:putative flippase GtrA
MRGQDRAPAGSHHLQFLRTRDDEPGRAAVAPGPPDRKAPQNARQPVAFLAIGVGSYLLDVGLLALLAGPIGLPVWAAGTAGFWSSMVFNFALNRSVFGRKDHTGLVAHGGRYALLVTINYLVTIAGLAVGTRLNLNILACKTFLVATISIWNYLLFRNWVFK